MKSWTEAAVERSASDNRGKKRYLQRIIQEQEAEDLIDEYVLDQNIPHRVDGLGRKRGDNR